MTAESQSPKPWIAVEEPVSDGRLFAPAVQRNRDFLADQLTSILPNSATILPNSATVLEIASGSGEHAVHFAARFPALVWRPSDPDPAAMASIEAWRTAAALANVRPPRQIDVMAANWWDALSADAVLCINMVHISPWEATMGLFRGCAELLTAQAPLILYGPYLEEGVETAESNLAFDQSLKARNPQWGLRKLRDMDSLAADCGFARRDRVEMPANNLMLVYRRFAA